MNFTTERRQALIDLLQNYDIYNQEEIVMLLKRDYGIEAGQTAISRDLKELGVIKHVSGKKRVYKLPVKDLEQQILNHGVTRVENNESMLVIHTLPGLAGFISEILDHRNLPIIGTIAGENVVFVSPQSVKEIDKLKEELLILFGAKEEGDS